LILPISRPNSAGSGERDDEFIPCPNMGIKNINAVPSRRPDKPVAMTLKNESQRKFSNPFQ
jgi:hypothetical protein